MVEYQQIKGVIHYAARKICCFGHHSLDYEDLISEGNVVFAESLLIYTDLEDAEFVGKFRKSVYNRFYDLLSYHKYSAIRGGSQFVSKTGKPTAIEETIDLSEEYEAVGPDNFAEMYYQEYVAEMFELLGKYPEYSEALTLFQLCINPPEEVELMAEQEFSRKNHLRQLGVFVRGFKQVKLRPKYFADYMGWDKDKLYKYLKLLKEFALQIIFEKPSENNLEGQYC